MNLLLCFNLLYEANFVATTAPDSAGEWRISFNLLYEANFVATEQRIMLNSAIYKFQSSL